MRHSEWLMRPGARGFWVRRVDARGAREEELCEDPITWASLIVGHGHLPVSALPGLVVGSEDQMLVLRLEFDKEADRGPE